MEIKISLLCDKVLPKNILCLSKNDIGGRGKRKKTGRGVREKGSLHRCLLSIRTYQPKPAQVPALHPYIPT
jgi:hypothetical protein